MARPMPGSRKSILIEALLLSFGTHRGLAGLTIGVGSPNFTCEAVD